MRITIKDHDEGYFGFSLNLQDFPTLVQLHLRHVPDTKKIEALGRDLVENKFTDSSLIEEFVKQVCNWGGYPGIWGRVLKRNEISDIQSRFQQALSLLKSNPPNVKEALYTITVLNSLDTSFASKHLRFLCPQRCPVFDSVLMQRLTYPSDSSGYQEFAEDCFLIASRLYASGTENPLGRERGQWFAADVEMALFAHFNRNEWKVE
jgi:hypothetical protein